jgi:hypothetical protein
MTLGGALLVAMVLATLVAPAATREEILEARSAEGRRDTLLLWEDGDNSNYPVVTGGEAGVLVAVKFVAPAWANHVKAIHYRIDTAGETAPFVARIWQAGAGGLPNSPAIAEQTVPGGYAGDAWLELALAESVYLGDDFPGGIFFAGLEILHDFNPQIAVDVDGPIDQMSYRWDLAEWQLLEHADAMIRVLVSDAPTAAAACSWTEIKALYR